MSATPARLTLSPAAAEQVRVAIREAGGNEVCFVARVAEGGVLSTPRVVSRGNATAVLAAVGREDAGSIVLHNHPSGALDPSQADLSVAARLWEEGLGFAITDNEATRLYVVVEPPEERADVALRPDEVAADLAPGGPISRHHPRYEDRPGQRDFAALVAESYNRGGVAVAEAGTGTGKSIAYLLPSIRWALANRERTVVSTNTINLQEQLVGKDLPFLREALGEDFRFSLVKGRRNYISIRRARLALETGPALFEDDRSREMTGLADWLEQTEDGSLSDLSFRPSPDVWDEVASESDVCLGARCPHFQECFYQKARRQAASADVLVVNHHLLFSDLAVRAAQDNYRAPAVLPAYQRLILDEAHNVEEAATGHLGTQVSGRGLLKVLSRLQKKGRGVLPALVSAAHRAGPDLLSQASVALLQDRIEPAVSVARDRAAGVFARLDGVLDGAGVETLRLTDDFADHPAWETGLREELAGLRAALGDLGSGLRTLRERIQTDERARQQLEARLLELRGVESRIEGAARALTLGLLSGEGEVPLVRWVERLRGRSGESGTVVLCTAPLDLARVLEEGLFAKVRTVVLTSATLTAGGDFGFLRRRLGIHGSGVAEAVYPSPFDFAEQTRIVLPTDIPPPGAGDDARHDRATAAGVRAHAEITDGGIFVLFTSYRALRAVAERLRSEGVDGRWPLFVHGEAPRDRLVEDFVTSGRGILLGTSSFWEGVDVPGSPLRGVVIPRIPFKVPTEPVTAARLEAIEARGGSSFAEYMLPHAAIRLKQGAGRLIRARTDRGSILLLDVRLVRKSYGKTLLRSLPPGPLHVGRWHDLREDLTAFHQQPVPA